MIVVARVLENAAAWALAVGRWSVPAGLALLVAGFAWRAGRGGLAQWAVIAMWPAYVYSWSLGVVLVLAAWSLPVAILMFVALAVLAVRSPNGRYAAWLGVVGGWWSGRTEETITLLAVNLLLLAVEFIAGWHLTRAEASA